MYVFRKFNFLGMAMTEILFYNGGLFVQPIIPPPPPAYAQYQAGYDQYRGRTYLARLPIFEMAIKSPNEAEILMTKELPNDESEIERYREFSILDIFPNRYKEFFGKQIVNQQWEKNIFTHAEDYISRPIHKWQNETMNPYMLKIGKEAKIHTPYIIPGMEVAETDKKKPVGKKKPAPKKKPVGNEFKLDEEVDQEILMQKLFNSSKNFAHYNQTFEKNKKIMKQQITQVDKQLRFAINLSSKIYSSFGNSSILLQQWIDKLTNDRTRLSMKLEKPYDNFIAMQTWNAETIAEKIANVTKEVKEFSIMFGMPDRLLEDYLQSLKETQKNFFPTNMSRNVDEIVVSTAADATDHVFEKPFIRQMIVEDNTVVKNATEFIHNYLKTSSFSKDMNFTVDNLDKFMQGDDYDENEEFDDPEDLLNFPPDAFDHAIYTELEAADRHIHAVVRTVINGRESVGFPMLPVIQKMYEHIQNATKDTIDPTRIRYEIVTMETDDSALSKITSEFGRRKYIDDHVSSLFAQNSSFEISLDTFLLFAI